MKVVALSLLALLVLSASPVFAGEPGGPGAPNDKGGVTDANVSIAVNGTWKDVHHFFASSSLLGVVNTITTETCGTVTGGENGTYCEYRNIQIDEATGIGTLNSIRFCDCSPAPGAKHTLLQTIAYGTVGFLNSTTEFINYHVTVQRSFGSVIKSGSFDFTGTLNVRTLLGSGTYTGAIN